MKKFDIVDQGRMLERIEKVSNPACEIAMKYYGGGNPSLKDDRSFVTRADVEIEELLTRELSRLIPGSMVVGEESRLDAVEKKRVREAEWVWVIDPVDGTASFVDRLPNFSICIGLARKGKPYVGVVRFPVTGDRYLGARGYGAFFNGSRIRLDRSITVDSNSTYYVHSVYHRRFRMNFGGKIRNLGSTAAHLALLARGAGVAVVADSSVWDYMAAAAILLEAGGTIKYFG